MTEQEWQQAYAANSIKPNVPFLGSKLDLEEEKVEEEKDEAVGDHRMSEEMRRSSRLGLDAIAEQVRTIGPTEQDFDQLLEQMDEHPTVDWTQGKNVGSHDEEGQLLPVMLNLS